MIQQSVVLSLRAPILCSLTTQKSRYLRIFAKGSSIYGFYLFGFSLIFAVLLAVLLALLLGEQVETGFQVRRLRIFLRYRRNRQK